MELGVEWWRQKPQTREATVFERFKEGLSLVSKRKSTMMTRPNGITWKAFVVGSLMCAAITPLSAHGKKKNEPKTDLTPLMVAASNCNLDEVKALLRQGADIKALDGMGRDALTYASAQRTKPPDLALLCPDVVLALSKAGADPWSARFYQSPELTQHKPTKIAVLRVEDMRRDAKDNREKTIEKLTDGVQGALSQNRMRMATVGDAGGLPVKGVRAAHYPIMTLNETRQKLKAAGFSQEEVIHPERKRACSVLGVDAVFEANLKDYHHSDSVLMEESAAAMDYSLTDCRTGELLWRNAPAPISEERGWIVRGFISGSTTMCEVGITLPRY
jgi:ankyrin repeat protein